MARILAYTSPGRSHLFVVTPILDELRRRGHHIALRTLAAEVPGMRAHGFDAAPIDPAIEAVELDDWRARNRLESVRIDERVFSARAEHDAPDLTRAIAQERPDAVLVDINSWGSLMAAEAWGGPWAAFCPYPLALPSTEAPPFGLGLPPARGPLGRARDRIGWPLVMGAVERRGRPALNAIRARLGLPPVTSVAQWFASAPLMLYMTAEPFEYPRREWPANLVMVGPCAWDPPYEPPPWLAHTTRPLVVVGTSTEFQDDGRLVHTALQALAAEPVTVVATLPTGDLDAFEVPPNAHVERFVPHTPLLARAACAVTHGGMGSTQKALAHGVPVCAVPFGRDQFEVARRVEVAGAGTRLPARRLRPDRLRAKVREAMACTAGAQRIADAFAATGGARTAADAYETRLLGIAPDHRRLLGIAPDHRRRREAAR
jgi:MGT family glycosyltransferase